MELTVEQKARYFDMANKRAVAIWQLDNGQWLLNECANHGGCEEWKADTAEDAFEKYDARNNSPESWPHDAEARIADFKKWQEQFNYELPVVSLDSNNDEWVLPGAEL